MFKFQLAFRGDKDGILGPRQVRHIAETTAGQHRPVHSAMPVIRQHAAHPSTPGKQDPARTVAVPGEVAVKVPASPQLTGKVRRGTIAWAGKRGYVFHVVDALKCEPSCDRFWVLKPSPQAPQ
jgi:hypothetical protein